ncbi:MAG: hypothetical protein JJ975_12920 [Bacteroidia bacterium]|nr:hypothetical protein [Bacteroidia bacterium]
MKAQKIGIALVVMFFTNLAYGQNPWLNTSPFKLGVGLHSRTINDVYHGFRYEQIDNLPGNSGPLTKADDNQISHLRMPMVFENIGKNLHHETSVTGVWDVLWDLLGGTKTMYEGGPEARRFEMFRTHWAFGGWIQDKYGVFGGAQYAYSTVRLQDPSAPDEMIVGGNERGFHVTGMLNLDRALIKSRFMYDWVRMSKGHQTGSAFTVDVQAYYGLNKERSFGVFGGLRFKTLSQTGPAGTPTEDWRNKGIQNQGVSNFSYQFPDMKMSETYTRFGIYAMLFGSNK